MPTIGEQLKQAREARKLSREKAAQATRIRAQYIEAMEGDSFTSMSSPAQARGFLRIYAEFLGLNANEWISPPVTETPPEPTGGEKERAAPEPPLQTVVDAPTPIVYPTSPAEPSPSQLIFQTMGAQLRSRRELLGLSLAEVEQHTRVREHYLASIESGEIENLPSPVQARGMISSYARFLDLDPESVLLRFAEGLQTRRSESQQATPTTNSRPQPAAPNPVLKIFLSPDFLFGGSMVLILGGLLVWGASYLTAPTPVSLPTETAPSISDILLAEDPTGQSTESGAPTSMAEITTPFPGEAVEETSATATLPLPSSNIVRVTIIVRERTYLRVIVDGEIRQEGRVAPGAALTFDGEQSIEVLTGNGAAVQIRYNEADQGLMGTMGQVVARIYTTSGIWTPTPTLMPTATITPRVSPSPTPTLTLIPSATPILEP